MKNAKDTKEAQLEKINIELINATTAPLYSYRTENNYLPVIGDGNPDASILFIGEAPGKNEALTGKPFCGASGRILDTLLASIGVKRENVYITNVVKDRPPENRDPSPEDIAFYTPYLERQLHIIRPKVIATLGRFGMEYIMKLAGLENQIEPISAAHGKVFTAKMPFGEVYVVPLYHPAASIYNQKLKETLAQDFQLLKKLIS